MNNNEIMNLAIDKARKTMNNNEGGPFGAVITDKEGNVICVESNNVLKLNDPTAHAEVLAIRKACEILKTHDLSNYILYASGFPCPMCLGAIMWANIKDVYYANSLKDAYEIGFKDDFIYDEIKNNFPKLNLKKLDNTNAIKLYNEYKDENKEIY